MLYIAAFGWMYTVYFFVFVKVNEKGTLPVAGAALLPWLIMVGLRGNVGVDTAFYIGIVESLWDRDALDIFIEPVFLAYSRLLLGIGFEPRLVVNVLGVCNCALLYSSFRAIERRNCIFFLLLAPIFLVDYSMNGLRAGTAAGLIGAGYSRLKEGHVKTFALFGGLAVLSHVSILYVLMLVLIEHGGRYLMRGVVVVGLILIIGILAGDQLLLYFGLKYAAYMEEAAEPILGIAPFALNILTAVWLGFAGKRRAAAGIRGHCALLGAMASLFFMLVPLFPWFAARMMWLNLFYLSIRCAWVIGRSAKKISGGEVLSVFAIGLLGLMSHLRQFYLGQGLTSSPFLPFRWMWD